MRIGNFHIAEACAITRCASASEIEMKSCVSSLYRMSEFSPVFPTCGTCPKVKPRSTTDVTAVCGHAENTSERREKEVQVSLDLPNAACVLLLVRYDWTRSGRRNLVVRNVVWNPVMRVNVPHASVHALGLALIVTSAISEPARVIAVKSALILRRQATAPLAISAIRSAAVLAIIAVVIRIIVTITVSVLIDAIAVLVPISIPIAILIAMVLIITVVAAMITIAAAVIVVLISFGLIITVLRGGRSY